MSYNIKPLSAEMSRLSFDERILVFAENKDVPLLERVRFLAMFGERQDDFFMTTVGKLKNRLANGTEDRAQKREERKQKLRGIQERAGEIQRRAESLLMHELLPALKEQGIYLLRWEDTTCAEQKALSDAYGQRLEEILTPVGVRRDIPFPHARNRRPTLALVVTLEGRQETFFTTVELPGSLPRLLSLPGERRFVRLEDFLVAEIPRLVEGLEVKAASLFRVTRSAVTKFEDISDLSVLKTVEQDISIRPFQAPVRVEVEKDMPLTMRKEILAGLQQEKLEEVDEITFEDFYEVEGLLDLVALFDIASIEEEKLHFKKIERREPFEEDRSVFDIVSEKDRLVQFPYDSFPNTAQRLVTEAACDPHVTSIMVTLYRTETESEVVKALVKAREQGKEATVIIELKASFDEHKNIKWAKALAEAGINVVF